MRTPIFAFCSSFPFGIILHSYPLGLQTAMIQGYPMSVGIPTVCSKKCSLFIAFCWDFKAEALLSGIPKGVPKREHFLEPTQGVPITSKNANSRHPNAPYGSLLVSKGIPKIENVFEPTLQGWIPGVRIVPLVKSLAYQAP